MTDVQESQELLSYVERFNRPYKSQSQQKIAIFPSVDLQCIRRAVLGFLGYPDEPTSWEGPPQQRQMLQGNLLHPGLAQMFDRAGMFLGTEVHAALKNPNVSFRPDYVGRARTKELARILKVKKGTKVVLEFKTVNQQQLNYYCPNEEHVKQLMWYMGTEGVKIGVLVYWCRGFIKRFAKGNGSDLIMFVVRFDPKLFKEIQADFNKIMKFVKAKKLPRRPFDSPDKFPCSGCPKHNACWVKN